MLLYIIRHGDPNYNPDSLTERGKLQAAALAKRLARYGVDRIYSSPLKRAADRGTNLHFNRQVDGNPRLDE